MTKRAGDFDEADEQDRCKRNCVLTIDQQEILLSLIELHYEKDSREALRLLLGRSGFEVEETEVFKGLSTSEVERMSTRLDHLRDRGLVRRRDHKGRKFFLVDQMQVFGLLRMVRYQELEPKAAAIFESGLMKGQKRPGKYFVEEQGLWDLDLGALEERLLLQKLELFHETFSRPEFKHIFSTLIKFYGAQIYSKEPFTVDEGKVAEFIKEEKGLLGIDVEELITRVPAFQAHRLVQNMVTSYVLRYSEQHGEMNGSLIFSSLLFKKGTPSFAEELSVECKIEKKTVNAILGLMLKDGLIQSRGVKSNRGYGDSNFGLVVDLRETAKTLLGKLRFSLKNTLCKLVALHEQSPLDEQATRTLHTKVQCLYDDILMFEHFLR